MIAAAELDASIGMAPSLPSCAAVAPHTSLRINQLHHRNPMLLGAFAALDVGRHIIALARLVHGIIDLDLSTVEMKRQSRRLSSHTPLRASATHRRAGHCHLALCCDPQWRVRRMRSSLKRYAQSIEGAMNVSEEYCELSAILIFPI